MPKIISIGSNCHPAYWLRKAGLQEEAYPFDWLLTPAHCGLAYCMANIENDFSIFLNDISLDRLGRCVSKNYPSTILYHHSNLVSVDPNLSFNERLKLERRAKRFENVITNEPVILLYCYDLAWGYEDEKIHAFNLSITSLLNKLLNVVLLVYFMKNDTDPALFRCHLIHHERLIVKKYIRDTQIDKVWGTCPSFFNQLNAVSKK